MFHQTVPINADDFVDLDNVSGWDVVWAVIIVAVAVALLAAGSMANLSNLSALS